MFNDNETAVALVMGRINDLTQSLRGNGFPRVTPAAEVDGKKLADQLRALQRTINDFLDGKL